MDKINRPITEEELAELDDFLNSDQVPEECLDLSGLHGFLTAITIGPGYIMPSEWLPIAIGLVEDDVEENYSEGREDSLELIMRMYTGIVSEFYEDPDNFEPLIYFLEFNGKSFPIISDWCYGFVRGMSLRMDSWKSMMESEDASLFLTIPLLFGTEEGLQELEAYTPDEIAHISEGLPYSVLGIYEYWLNRKAPTPLIN
ncbi:UPF0149 family protein [Dissulfuribacter thermophilus]|nr:UPF0149 family protein [Dissulfuribacter thermophilus]